MLFGVNLSLAIWLIFFLEYTFPDSNLFFISLETDDNEISPPMSPISSNID